MIMFISKLRNPIIFAKYILDFNPFEYQAKLLADNSKRICAVMGRQTGKSTTIAAKAIHFSMTNPNTTTLIVSATLRQSLLLFEKILSFINNIRTSVSYVSKTRISLTNNSNIIALPCGSGSTLRGYTASLLILDEAAFMPADVINNVLMPMISTTNGSIWMLSTPYSKDHPFYKAFTDSKWSIHHVPSSANPLIKEEFLEEQRRFIGELAFKQEYEAEFVDDQNAFFPSNLVQKCIGDVSNNFTNIYAGFDPGGRSDPAGLVLINVDKIYEVVYKRIWYGIDYTTINEEVADICKRYNVSKLCIDQTGLGNPITENISKLLGYDKVVGITLTATTKEEILLNLRLLFEEQKIRIPFDEELLSNLSCISYKKRSIGYKFEHANGTHDDLAFALALACWIAKDYTNGVVINI
ncbi:MAG: hypothetical protein KatS3mg003_0995 [Candidatus Nitrosocaldaceae archaeon]|nr:MAG: hypothetical protein KatS3mg003_0995 [Candidatus Nitrosocaldaceae archaeon]